MTEQTSENPITDVRHTHSRTRGARLLRRILFWLAAAACAVFCAALFLLNCNRITYREHVRFDGEALKRLQENAVSNGLIIPLDEEPKISISILQQLGLRIKDDAPRPAIVQLFHEDGTLLQEMPFMQMVNFETQYRVSFRMRPFQKAGDYLVLRNENGGPYDLSNVTALTLYGGNRDFFWVGLTIFFTLFVLVFLIRAGFLVYKDRAVLTDGCIRVMLTAAAAFAFITIFASLKGADNIDEFDNMIGGLVQVHQHKVIYRDYITQHTPVAYWLCALFAFLGARSPEQFRLLFHITYALIWGAVWFRHRKTALSRPVALMGVLWPLCANVILGHFTGTVLSDNIQALAMTILLLEMICYFKDHSFAVSRCVIVSLCIFASVGSAFISVYAVAGMALSVLVSDIVFYVRQKKPVRFFVGRYALLTGLVAVPFLLAFGYLAWKGALKDMFEQAYLFNVQVYPKYQYGFGTNKFEPVQVAFRAFWRLMRDSLRNITGRSLSVNDRIQTLTMCLTLISCIGCFVSLIRRRFAEGLGIFAFIVLQAARGIENFHAAMFWQVITMYAVIHLPGLGPVSLANIRNAVSGNRLLRAARKIIPAVWLLAALFWVGDAWQGTYRALLPEHMQLPDVSEKDMARALYMPADSPTFYTTTSLYLLYKNHYPVNDLVWLFPWYCEWYEEDVARQLETALPDTAIYDPDEEIWGYKDFTPHIKAVIEKYYEPSGLDFLYRRKD